MQNHVAHEAVILEMNLGRERDSNVFIIVNAQQLRNIVSLVVEDLVPNPLGVPPGADRCGERVLNRVIGNDRIR